MLQRDERIAAFEALKVSESIQTTFRKQKNHHQAERLGLCVREASVKGGIILTYPWSHAWTPYACTHKYTHLNMRQHTVRPADGHQWQKTFHISLLDIFRLRFHTSEKELQSLKGVELLQKRSSSKILFLFYIIWKQWQKEKTFQVSLQDKGQFWPLCSVCEENYMKIILMKSSNID